MSSLRHNHPRVKVDAAAKQDIVEAFQDKLKIASFPIIGRN